MNLNLLIMSCFLGLNPNNLVLKKLNKKWEIKKIKREKKSEGKKKGLKSINYVYLSL